MPIIEINFGIFYILTILLNIVMEDWKLDKVYLVKQH